MCIKRFWKNLHVILEIEYCLVQFTLMKRLLTNDDQQFCLIHIMIYLNLKYNVNFFLNNKHILRLLNLLICIVVVNHLYTISLTFCHAHD